MIQFPGGLGRRLSSEGKYSFVSGKGRHRAGK